MYLLDIDINIWNYIYYYILNVYIYIHCVVYIYIYYIIDHFHTISTYDVIFTWNNVFFSIQCLMAQITWSWIFCFYHSSVCASPILKPSPHSNSPLVFHMCFALHFSYWRFSISCFSNAKTFGLSLSLYPRVFLSETFWLVKSSFSLLRYW